MTIIDVVFIVLMFVVVATATIASAVMVRSECRINRELLRMRYEWIEKRMKDND
mgnify:CR=1 FL=1